MYERTLRTLLISLALAGTAGAGSALAATPAVAPNVFSAHTTAIAVRVGQTFLISLDSNPTTGYSWSAEPPAGGIVEVEGSSYRAPDRTMPGAGGTQIFIVKALAAGKATLNAGYARPFEKGKAPVRAVTFTISVGP